jgi:hypothetical protein
MPGVPTLTPRKPKRGLPKLKPAVKTEKKELPKLKPDRFPRGRV